MNNMGIKNSIKIKERKQDYNDSCFQTGQILKLCPGYHTTKPYYCEVVFYDKYAKTEEVKMITYIPGQHQLEWRVGNNWDYHIRRVEMIYYKKDFPEFLLNQTFNK